MLNELNSMETEEDFDSVAKDLLSADKRVELFGDILEELLVFKSEDLWTNAYINEITNNQTNITKALQCTVGEGLAERTLHRLQLLGYLNPGIQTYIDNYLSRACV